MRLLVFILILSLTAKIVFNVLFDSSQSFWFYGWILFLLAAIVISFFNRNRVEPKLADKNLIVHIGESVNLPERLPGLNKDGVSYIPFYCNSGYHLNNKSTQNKRLDVIREINEFMKKHKDYKVLNIEHVCNDRGWLEEIGVWLVRKDNLTNDETE